MTVPRRTRRVPYPERLYLVGENPDDPGRLDLVTLFVAKHTPTRGMGPEPAAIVRMCEQPLSMAEISAHMRLPTSVLTLVLADMVTAGELEARAPIPAASLPDIDLLKAVMHGLQRL
ncbi:DUF742 domain-containing protein [Embleya sp. NPDC055664]|uniref:DUF742 domain-containing protein n=1 Tax=Embleya sp. NPDC059237 TaxID=3346784 RepID=UPI0036805F31